MKLSDTVKCCCCIAIGAALCVLVVLCVSAEINNLWLSTISVLCAMMALFNVIKVILDDMNTNRYIIVNVESGCAKYLCWDSLDNYYLSDNYDKNVVCYKTERLAKARIEIFTIDGKLNEWGINNLQPAFVIEANANHIRFMTEK